MVFRSHPQLIQRFFNTYWFGPPPRVTGGSAWPWIDHPASGLSPPTQRAVRTRFRFGSGMALALPARTTRRLIMQKARSHPRGLLQLEGAWVQVLFHSPRGVLFTFPSRYWFAIGRWLVFSLGGWALRIQAGFHVSRPTWDPGGSRRASRRGLSPAMARLSRRSRSPCFDRDPVPQPRGTGPPVWAISAFARRYLRNRVFLLLLRLLRCFTSPGVARSALFGSCTRGILWDAGFPHSETSGSKTACVSPELIAACRVLRRLPPPRHPPCARTVWTPNSAPRRHWPPARTESRGTGACPLTGPAENTGPLQLFFCGRNFIGSAW